MSADQNPKHDVPESDIVSRWAGTVKRHPLMSGAAALIALVGTVGTLSDYAANLWSFYKSEMTHRSAYEALSRLDIGLGIDYVWTLFGTPTLTSDLEWNDLRESLFTAADYKVQVVHKPDGRVIFYAVLALSPNFRPPIPSTDAYLGERSYSGVQPDEFTSVALVSLGWNQGRYIERSGGSRASGSRILYLAYESHRGHEFDGVEVQYEGLADLLDYISEDRNKYYHELKDEFPKLIQDYQNEWSEFRSQYRPNGYGVGEAWLHSDNLFYYTAFGSGRTPEFSRRY
jgi:hypothetical protein